MAINKKHWGYRTGKWVLYIIGVYLGLMLILTLVLLGYRQAMVKKVTRELNESVQGDLKIADIDVSLWKYFPRVGVEVKGVSITDSLYKKPFLKADLLALRVGFWELFGSDLDVQSIRLSGVAINNFTDSNGYSNAYVIRPIKKEIPSKENPGKKKTVVLRRVDIDDFYFKSVHVTKEKDFDIHLMKGTLLIDDTNGDAWNISFNQDIQVGRLGFNMARGAWIKNKRLRADWKANYYPSQSKIVIQETPVFIGPQPYKISAVFNLSDSGLFSLKVSTDNLPYKEGVSLLADNVQRKLMKVDVKSRLHVDAIIEGGLAYKSDPKVKVDWVALPGQVVTPVVTLDSVAFYGHYYNERVPGMGHKDDNSEIVLQKITAKWGPVLLHGDSVVMTNLKDPTLQFRFTSGINLALLDDKLDLSTLSIDNGTANLELKYNGPLLVNADALGKMTATMQVMDASATYIPRSLKFAKINGNILLAENRLELDNLSTLVNGNLVKVDLLGRQIGYFINSKGEAQGDSKSSVELKVFSPKIDLQTLSGLLAKRTGARQRKRKEYTTYPLKQIDDILERGTLALDLKINELINDKLKATNIRGEVIFVQEDLQLRKLAMDAAGGHIVVDAELKRRPDGNLDAVTHTNISKVNVSQLFYAMDNFGQTGITNQNLEGTFSTKANVKAIVAQTGGLVPQSVDGRIDFVLENGALKNHEGIQNIKKFIFKKRDLANIQFAKVSNELLIRNDTVYIPRMEIYSSALLMFVQGKYGLKGGTDMSVQLPLSNLKNKEDEFNEDDNIGTDTKVGPSVWFRARQREDGTFKFGLDAFKKLRKKEEIPTVEVKSDSADAKPVKM